MCYLFKWKMHPLKFPSNLGIIDTAAAAALSFFSGRHIILGLYLYCGIGFSSVNRMFHHVNTRGCKLVSAGGTEKSDLIQLNNAMQWTHIEHWRLYWIIHTSPPYTGTCVYCCLYLCHILRSCEIHVVIFRALSFRSSQLRHSSAYIFNICLCAYRKVWSLSCVVDSRKGLSREVVEERETAESRPLWGFWESFLLLLFLY